VVLLRIRILVVVVRCRLFVVAVGTAVVDIAVVGTVDCTAVVVVDGSAAEEWYHQHHNLDTASVVSLDYSPNHHYNTKQEHSPH